MEDMSRKKLFILILIVLIVSVLVRFSYLKMDPPSYQDYGTAWFDEGAYANNARNKVLFGDWKAENDSWNPMYISPTFNYLEFLSFKNLGVSTFSMRLIPAIFGFLSIIISTLLLMSRKFEEGAIFFILFSINPMLVMFNRIAMVEYLLLFFISIIIALMIRNKTYCWILAGFLVPLLFFSKMITLFFIAAIPISLLLYYKIYNVKSALKKFNLFFIGLISSSLLWLFWLIPNFNNWIIANFGGYGSRIGISVIKESTALFRASQFFLLNPIIVAISIVFLILTVSKIRKKEKLEFIELFSLIAIILFSIQTFLADYALNRFLLLLPLLSLVSAIFMSGMQGLSINIKNKSIIFSKSSLIFVVLLVYFLFSLTQLGIYFSVLSQNSEEAHTIFSNSKEISLYIKNETKVYGRYANALSLENEIKPYFSTYHMDFANTDEKMLPLLEEKEINYAILKENIFDDKEIAHYKGIENSKVYDYIKDNFEIIKTIKGKHTRLNSQDDIYIYKRK